MLRSSEEQFGIISSFASWLKISPMRLQFKSITRKADSDKHVAMVKRDLAAEENQQCKHLGEGYIRLIKDVGSREALTRRFFLIFQYEELTWRKQQMMDMLKSMDMYTSDCRFQQEDALKSVMPFLHITPSLERNRKGMF